MKILAIDDEINALNSLRDTLIKIDPDAEVVCFRRAKEFIEYPEKDSFDVAFLDIDLGKVSGIEVALSLKQHAPKCNIVFVTSHKEFAFDALSVRPSGYVLKPYAEEQIKNELCDLRYPTQEKNTNNRLNIKTFGNFTVTDNNGSHLHFSRTISKEILAYLIDQGGFPVTSRDIASDVLEINDFDSSASKKISQYINDLIKDLKNAGYSNIIIKQNRQLYINRDAVCCDLYNLLNGDVSALNSYNGEYMIEYSWAEFSCSNDSLMQHIKDLRNN